MAHYNAHGFGVFEIEFNAHIKKRVVFAISEVTKPAWLAWYIFSESMTVQLWQNDFDLASVYDKPAQRFARIGRPTEKVYPSPFWYDKHIAVSAFAPGHRAVPGTLSIGRKPSFSCVITIIVPKASAVALSLDFIADKPERNDIDVRRQGMIYFTGAVPFSPHAIKAGPPARSKSHPSSFDFRSLSG